MSVSRTDYVLNHEGWDATTMIAAVCRALGEVAPDVTAAETDIPWDLDDTWPPDVAQAADRLRRRFALQPTGATNYLQTGVQPVSHDETSSDFVAFAPYAYDSTLWCHGTVLAQLADEGSSLILSLTAEQRDRLELALGFGRVVSQQDWRENNPSALRRLGRRLGCR